MLQCIDINVEHEKPTSVQYIILTVGLCLKSIINYAQRVDSYNVAVANSSSNGCRKSEMHPTTLGYHSLRYTVAFHIRAVLRQTRCANRFN